MHPLPARALLGPLALLGLLLAAAGGGVGCGGDGAPGPGGDPGAADAAPDATVEPPLPACQAPGPAAFTVRPDQVIASDFVGYGGQFNNNAYAAISAEAGLTPEALAEMEERTVALRPDHVRIFWDPDGDADRTESFERVVELAQRSGASVNVTWWHGPYPDPAGQMRSFADRLIRLVDELGLDAVRYVTIQNEVNSTMVTPETYEALYRALDRNLRDAGLRDRIQFVCGDLLRDKQRLWFDYMAAHMSDVCDGYSVHIYWDYFDIPKLVERLTEVRAIVDSLPEAGRKPLYVTEFGVRGMRTGDEPQPGRYSDGELLGRTNENALQHAWFNILSSRLGYVATVKWDVYFAMYDRTTQYYSMIGIPPAWFLKPIYHATRVFTHTVDPGWDIVRVDGHEEWKLVTAFRGPRGHTTVFGLNKDRAGARSFAVTGLPPGVPLRLVVWHGEATGELSTAELTSGADCTASFTVPPRSFAALTTVDPLL